MFGEQKITTKVYMMTPPETDSVVVDILDFMWKEPVDEEPALVAR